MIYLVTLLLLSIGQPGNRSLERVIVLGILVGTLAIISLVLHHAHHVIRQQTVALQASEERYRLITACSKELIVVVDHAGSVCYASSSFRQTLGYDPASMIGQPAFAHLHPDDIADTTVRLALAHKAATGLLTFRLRDSEGVWRWIEAQSAPSANNGRPAFLLVGRDITECKQLEEERYQTQTLYSLGHITRSVVHDVNNMLTGIAGYAELCLHRMPSGHTMREDLEEIRATAMRAAALTNHLYAFVQNQPSELQSIDRDRPSTGD
jgi:PAS domain S-box-containing protein